MDRLRFLFVSPYYKPAHVYGGPSYSIPALCESLARMGAHVTVFTTNANGKADLPIPPGVMQEVEGVQVYYFQRDLPGNYFYSSQLRSACHSHISRSAFDLVYVASNWGHPFLPACRASLHAGIPYVVSPRASFKRNTWKGKFLKKMGYHLLFERALLQKASLIHYTTALESNDSRWLGLKPREAIVPNPLSLKEFESLPPKGRFRNRHDITASRKVILILGRVDPDKGLDLALQALSRIVPRFPDAVLVIAGPEENNQVRYLREQAETLGVSEHVLFTGLLDLPQKLEAFVDADVFFSPSRSENFGMSIVEAMACGLPVVVSDQVGVADMIGKEEAGLVVPLDPAQMADALMRLLDDPEWGGQLGQDGLQVVSENFASQAVARHLLHEFEAILGGTAEIPGTGSKRT